MEEILNKKVTVEGGRYISSKSINWNVYKIIQTDVEFYDNKIRLSKGQGFLKPKNITTTEILYNNIVSSIVKRKCSSTNIIISCTIVIAAVLSGIWLALICAAVPIVVGFTAVVEIQHSNGTYEIPTEFKEDADKLASKIYLAISQSK